MPSALELMGQGMITRANYAPAAAMGIVVADSVAGFGASIGIAEVYARYHDKWYGKWAPEITAGVGKLLEGILTLFVGPGWLSGLSGAVGQAGLNLIGAEIGLNHARKAMGIAVVKVPAGTDVKALKSGSAVPASTAVGAIPQAAAGRGLAWDHIQDLASGH